MDVDEAATFAFEGAWEIGEVVLVVVANIGAEDAILGIEVKAGLAAPAGHQRKARGQSAPAGQNRRARLMRASTSGYRHV